MFKRIAKELEERRLVSNLRYMTAEQAYSLTTVKHVTDADDVFGSFVVSTIEAIKKMIADREGTVFERLIYLPDYLNASYREAFTTRMRELGYQVLYADETLCLVSWRHLKEADRDGDAASTERRLIKG